ncbi:UDP-glucose 4-epimerase GalE [Virgibacillus siamensis]|uniref:UDP-glucose 4-epimerase GalE n=1 Tax=Virgibacillus siamensis TaxID=480071 RepID=UPI000987705D|nr:UDP-glucose 4-epimerase GalE [Virgibacillus siamensis]
MAILVTGGAGYIGSHTVLYLKEQGEDVIVLDDLSKGHHDALMGTGLYRGTVGDKKLLDSIFTNHRIDAVIHFAASSLVGESVNDPLTFYENNVTETCCLLQKMNEHHVKHIVFSSTAAVYGEPKFIPIQEKDETMPANPYGETKHAVEKMLHWSDQAYGIKSISLRYFNAAGADPLGRIGEDHKPESHLIPIVLEVALGQREFVKIFGNDYNTDDGTCVRDYIHVMDLAQAHYLAVQKLKKTNESTIYNLGNGQGFSVKQVVDACRNVTGLFIGSKPAPRRGGDPATLIASSEKARDELDWLPQYPELETMVSHAWNWHRHHKNGFNR